MNPKLNILNVIYMNFLAFWTHFLKSVVVPGSDKFIRIRIRNINLFDPNALQTFVVGIAIYRTEFSIFIPKYSIVPVNLLSDILDLLDIKILDLLFLLQ